MADLALLPERFRGVLALLDKATPGPWKMWAIDLVWAFDLKAVQAMHRTYPALAAFAAEAIEERDKARAELDRCRDDLSRLESDRL